MVKYLRTPGAGTWRNYRPSLHTRTQWQHHRGISPNGGNVRALPPQHGSPYSAVRRKSGTASSTSTLAVAEHRVCPVRARSGMAKIARNDIIPQLSASYHCKQPNGTHGRQRQDRSRWQLGHVRSRAGEGDFSAVMSTPARPTRQLPGEIGAITPMAPRMPAPPLCIPDSSGGRAENWGAFNRFALAPDGLSLSGRMYQRDQVVGAPVTAIKDTGRPAILSVYPRSAVINETSEVVVQPQSGSRETGG